MIDRLEKQILKIISNASSLVRTVTRREIEVGVLSPSLTAMDIRRNLPRNIQLNVIESRLRLLEKDGYIYSEGDRWWLTEKGKTEVGDVKTQPPYPDQLNRSVSSLIEDVFARHGEKVASGESVTKSDSINVIISRLVKLYSNQQLSDEEKAQSVRTIISKTFRRDDAWRTYLETRKLELTIEISRLEDQLTKKRQELHQIRELIDLD